MPYLAVTHKDQEAIFDNKPNKKENSFYSYSGQKIILPPGTIKKIIGRDLKFIDEPVEIK